MNDALFGYTGLVGQTLLRQREFQTTYRSTNISECRGRSFETVVCAAAPAKKWLANQKPEEDRAIIGSIIEHLASVRSGRFILISTVDVFADPVGVDESTVIELSALSPYGRHRRELELAVLERFPRSLIVRLPGLVGPGLKKNIIFDLHHSNNLHAIDSRGVFQFYPLVNLWPDIETAWQAGLRCVHLTAAPVSVARVAEEGFGRVFVNELPGTPARYDMQSNHASLYGSSARHSYCARETILAVRAYAQSEPKQGAR